MAVFKVAVTLCGFPSARQKLHRSLHVVTLCQQIVLSHSNYVAQQFILLMKNDRVKKILMQTSYLSEIVFRFSVRSMYCVDALPASTTLDCTP
jgi:hypothetical protein